MGCGIVNQFILNHYYDIFDEKSGNKGIYVCNDSKCGYKKKHELEVYETIKCPVKDCKGTMHLKIMPKKTIDKLLSGEIKIKLSNNSLGDLIVSKA